MLGDIKFEKFIEKILDFHIPLPMGDMIIEQHLYHACS